MSQAAPEKTKEETEVKKAPWRRIFSRQIARGLLVPLLALLAAFIVGGFFIIFSDMTFLAALANFSQDPLAVLGTAWQAISTAYSALFRGSIGDPGQMIQGLITLLQSGDPVPLRNSFYPLSEALTNSIPYIFGGLAVALGFRCGLFNIGVEGQLWIGGLASVFVGYSLTGLPWYIHLPLALLAGALAGAIWGAIPGYLKARTGAHEVINTIMMNYISYRLADYLLTGPMKRSGFIPVSPMIEKSAYLPSLLGGNLRVHAGLFLALGVALLVWWFLWKTTMGFEIRSVGANPRAARCAGMNITKNFVLAMGLSGALGGLAGTVQALGVTHAMSQGFSYGYGFDSIALALLGKSHPAGVVLASLLFGTLRAGASNMQILRIPIDIFQILQAMVIMFVAAPELIQLIFRLRVEREGVEAIFTRGWGQ